MPSTSRVVSGFSVTIRSCLTVGLLLALSGCSADKSEGDTSATAARTASAPSTSQRLTEADAVEEVCAVVDEHGTVLLNADLATPTPEVHAALQALFVVSDGIADGTTTSGAPVSQTMAFELITLHATVDLTQEAIDLGLPMDEARAQALTSEIRDVGDVCADASFTFNGE